MLILLEVKERAEINTRVTYIYLSLTEGGLEDYDGFVIKVKTSFAYAGTEQCVQVYRKL